MSDGKGAIEKLLELAEARLDCSVRVEFRIGADDYAPIICALVAGNPEGIDILSRVAATAEDAADLVLQQFSGESPGERTRSRYR